MITLAIIGSAGRGNDASRLNLPIWNQMKRTIHRFILDHGFKNAISGAAPCADHLAVGLFNAGFLDSLTLAIPCHFNWDEARFVHGTEPYRPADRLNQLHADFSTVIGKSSLQEIKTAIYNDSKVTVIQRRGFHERNEVVAERATHVIAFTFGHGNVCADGGTAYTIRSFLRRGKSSENVWHVDLNTMTVYEKGRVE